jgi:DNA-binding transcriptional ArsR family regulator
MLPPQVVSVRFALDPVINNLASLYMLGFSDTSCKLNEWVKQAAANLSEEQTHSHLLLTEIMYSAYEPDEYWPSFPAYLDHLPTQDPSLMRSRFLKHMFPHIGEEYVRRDELMDLDTFISEIDRSEFDREFGPDLLAEAHSLLADPPALRARVVAFLITMWRQILSAEWAHNEPFLREVVDAHQRRVDDFSGLTAYEAIQAVTGTDVHGIWQRVLGSTETLIFIPSPHIGPYLMDYAYVPVVRILFGARLPQVKEKWPTELDRSELLVQLRTLADETRLRILELLLDEGELHAQQITERLDLARSSSSRHLSQLSAAGFLVERQGTGKAKRYALNPERFRETLHFLERYAPT